MGNGSGQHASERTEKGLSRHESQNDPGLMVTGTRLGFGDLSLVTGDGITARLYAFNRRVGVSFDVASENGADAGNFLWVLFY